MDTQKRLKSLLLKAGLKTDEADLYIFVSENPGCSISDAYKNSGISRSSAYRAFESLRDLEILNCNSDSWKTNLQTTSLSGLIKKLEAEKRRKSRLITELKTLNTAQKLIGNSKIAGIETFEGEDVYQKYLDLSEMDFDTDLVYGDWEPFNQNESLVPLEKNFIQNRIKNGGNCVLILSGDGPNTREIIDCDFAEDRITKYRKESNAKNPVWINAFEGNNLVYIWNLDESGKTYGTLIESKPVSEFYKAFIYSQTTGK
ncbi:MAG: hypothetical protein ABII07_03600 [Patescibacteria group bacterium]|nr:hypothetical protein [Patescibacteria group bacterium]